MKNMTLPRRQILACLGAMSLWSGGALAQTSASPGVAEAQAFPTKAVRFIVSYGPGSAADVAARLLADGLSKVWGQSVLVDNRPGASGIVSVQELGKAKPDGYSYLLGDVSTLAINPSLFKKLPYDPAADLIPVVDVFWVPFIVWVSKDAPFASLKDLIAAAKETPDKYTYASTGTGSPFFVGGEMLKLRAEIKLLQVPFKDMGPLLSAVTTGEVTVVVSSVASMRPVIQRLRPLAIASPQRDPSVQNIPTSAEAGGPANFDVTLWGSLVTLRGTPAPILAKVRNDAFRVMQTPEFKERAASLGLNPSKGMNSEDLSKFFVTERTKYREVVEASGARAE